jgi:hypothetical protein
MGLDQSLLMQINGAQDAPQGDEHLVGKVSATVHGG